MLDCLVQVSDISAAGCFKSCFNPLLYAERSSGAVCFYCVSKGAFLSQVHLSHLTPILNRGRFSQLSVSLLSTCTGIFDVFASGESRGLL